MNTKGATAIALVAISGALLVGCDPGPACARWSTQTTFVSHYNPGTKTTSIQPVTTTVCVEYEKEKQ